MVLRNSILHIIRTPVKTLLFMLLLTLLTALLGQGLAMQAGSQAMLAAADQTFTTVVQIDGPSQDESARAAIGQLSVHPVVQAVDIERSASAWIESAQVPQQEPALSHLAILHFTVNHFMDSGAIVGIIQTVYFGRELRENIYISLSPADLNGQTLPLQWQKGHHYVALGFMFPTQTPMKQFTIAPNLGYAPIKAPHLDLGLLPAILDITEHEDLEPVWQDLAQVCQVLDASFAVTASSAIEISSPFYQRETYLTGGRLFTEAEVAAGADVCLISDRLAGLLGLTSGDQVFLNLHGGASGQMEQSYWPEPEDSDNFVHKASFRIVGTFKDVESQQFQIYVPLADWAGQQAASSQLARFKIVNSQVERFTKAATGQLPETCSLTVFDQGYAEAVKPIHALRAMALRLAGGTLAATLLTLLLFVHLQISKQRDSARIMLALGSGRRRTWASLVLSCILLGSLAALLGSVIGVLTAGSVTQKIWLAMQQVPETDLRYSIRKLAPLVLFSAELPTAGRQPWLAGGLIIVLMLILASLAALRLVLHQARAPGVADDLPPGRPRRAHTRHPVVHSLSLRPLALRMALLAIWRRPARSLIIPAVSLVLSALVVLLGQTQTHQAAQLASVHERIPVRAWFTTYQGTRNYNFGLSMTNDVNDVFFSKPDRPDLDWRRTFMQGQSTGLTPAEAQAEREQMLAATPDIRDRALSARFRYGLQGKVASADGTPAEPAPPLWPVIPEHNNAWGYDWFVQEVLTYDDLIFTEDLMLTPAFMQQALAVTFLAGYDNQSFKRAEAICVLPEDLMQAQGAALGDTIRLTAYLVVGDAQILVDVWDVRVVGSYQRQARAPTLYMPWLLLFENEFIPDGIFQNMPDRDLEMPVKQLLPGEFLAEPVYSAVLILDGTDDLTAFKDRLEDLDFTESGKLGGRRIAVVIDDKELAETVQTLTRQLRLMDLLIPGVLLLTAVIGFVVSWLLSRHRVREYALMRSLGNGHAGAFLAFFLEQAILYATGLLPVLVWLLTTGQMQGRAANLTGLFALCYGCGIVLSISVLRHRSVLDVLLDPS